ncbi:MAG: hypothetical protein ACPGN3_09565 [Opitutales bacterium]
MNPDFTAEVHVLTSQHDWLNLLWVLKSLYMMTSCRFSLCIHEDGSLSSEQIALIQEHFPFARIITRIEADEEMAEPLSDLRKLREIRASNPLILKVSDMPYFCRSERMFLLDSDVLFFDEPHTLFERIRSKGYLKNTLNRDWKYGYSISEDYPIEPLINSGLGLIFKDSVNLANLEEYLEIEGIFSHGHRIEQTLFALCSHQYGFEFLPREYDVLLGQTPKNVPSFHYTGPIRHRFYSEGLVALREKSDFFTK